MTRVLLFSVEPPWPEHHGGRLRTARVAEGLSRNLDVLVAFPDHHTRAEDPPVATRPLPLSRVTAARSRISRRPHLGGQYVLATSDALVNVYEQFRPDAIYWSHSYLAAWSPPQLRAVPQVVEFANIESHRLRTLAPAAVGPRRAVRAIEAAKAARWEPRVARDASLCVALSESDEVTLRGWSDDVVLAPNGVDLMEYQRSPAPGYALAMASYQYEPNVIAVRRLVTEVWPLVTRRLPAAELVVAGRGSESLRDEFAAIDGVRVLGSVADVGEAYAGSAVALAPASTGGGSQLKLTESLSRGRCVVMSPFAAKGLPGPLRDCEAGRVAGDPQRYAEAIVEAITDVDDRHRRERLGWQRCQRLSWQSVATTLTDVIVDVVTRESRS